MHCGADVRDNLQGKTAGTADLDLAAEHNGGTDHGGRQLNGRVQKVQTDQKVAVAPKGPENY